MGNYHRIIRQEADEIIDREDQKLLRELFKRRKNLLQMTLPSYHYTLTDQFLEPSFEKLICIISINV